MEIRIHFTFALLLIWVAARHGWGEQSLLALGQLVAVFATVVLHELGHALAARRYGIATHEITLLPIGGVARLARMPSEPRQELWVALAGPAVNLVLAALFFGLIRLSSPGAGSFLEWILTVNVSLLVFNLLPAFPLDGGRVLRALLAMRMGFAPATELAARVGQSLAMLIGLLGVFTNPMLVLIALFVFLAAAGESSAAQLEAAFAGLPVTRAMITDFRVLSPNDTLQRALDLTLQGTQRDFPVIVDGVLQGMLTQDGLLHALAQREPEDTIAEWVRRDYPPVEPTELLTDVVAHMASGEFRTLPVLNAGRLVGLISMDNLAELMLFQQATRRTRAHHIGVVSARPSPLS